MKIMNMNKTFQRTFPCGFAVRPGLLLRAFWLFPLSLAAGPAAFAQSSVGIADSQLQQPSNTTEPMIFTISRSGDTSADRLDVGFSTRDNTATAGEDYTATQSCVSFASGEVEKTFAVPILPGSADQDIDFKVDLAPPAADHVLPPVRSNFKPPVDAIFQKPDTNGTYQPFRNLESPDLNGDGWSDLVGFESTWNSDFRAGRLEVFAGNPGGSGGAFTYVDGYDNDRWDVSAVDFGDWNRDGVQDMIAAAGTTFFRFTIFETPPKGRIVITFGQASHPDIFQQAGEVFDAPYTFGELQVDTSVFKYIDPNSIKARDLDNDGDLDIVVDDQWRGFIHIYRNPAIGGQEGWTSIDLFNPDADVNRPVSFINVEDLDGDAYPDIMLTGGDSTVSTLRTMRNTTSPGAPLTFEAPLAHAGLANPSTTQRNHLIDVNCDNKPDVIFATGSGTSVALNGSSPGLMRFDQAVLIAPGESFPGVGAYRYTNMQPLAILTSRSSDSSIGLHVNNTCLDGQPKPSSAIQFIEEARRPTVSTQTGHRSSLVGTFYFGPRDNGNGLGDPFPEFVEGYKYFEDGTGFPKNSIAVHEFDAPRSENTTVFDSLGDQRHFYPATLDYDGDGRMDLLTAPKGASRVTFGRNITAQSGDLPIFEGKEIDALNYLSRPVVADFNRDGKPDFAIKSSRHIAVFLNKTVSVDPKFTRLDLPEGTEDDLTHVFRALAVGDLDGDGRPDPLFTAVLTGPIPAIRSFPNTTTPGASEATFGDELFYHFDDAMLGTPQDLASTDLNADGRDDLILVGDGSHKKIGVRLSIPGGTSTEPAYAEPVYFDLLTVGGTPSLSYFEIHTGDLNGDGRPDIALSYRNGRGSIFINETPMDAEQPVFRAEQRFGPASGQFAGGFDVADMNGDCLADIALSTAAADDVYLLINQGEDAGGVIQFSEVGPYVSALSPHHLVTADFNFDGRRDFATSNRPTDRLFTNWMTIHATQFNAPSSTLDPLASTATGTIISVLDSDGDGMPDIYEIDNGLDPDDPGDADEDPDGDGLSNIEEFNKGTDPHDPDSDGDGISDGVDHQPLSQSNACIEDGNGDALFEFTAPANMVTQCAASNAVSVSENAVIHVDAMLHLIAPRVGFSPGVSVPQGAVMRVWQDE